MNEERISFEDFNKIKLKIAEIVAVDEHPKADKLIIMQIKIGEENRQIVAGIKPYRPEYEKLVGKKIVIVSNLEPAKIRGVESNGMLLAVGGRENEPFALLTVDEDVPSGLTVL
jgi:methionyl-tRNA synthetase